MNIIFKITDQLRAVILRDLERSHLFAAERVGFISCRPARTSSGLLIAAAAYHPVDDSDYLRSSRVGAMMGPDAIRKALQISYGGTVSMFHVHLHDHLGMPGFSSTDLRETAKFVPNFFNVQSALPHGALVLSRNSAVARCWVSSNEPPVWVSKVTIVGAPISLIEKL